MIMKGVDEHTTDIFCHHSLEALIENEIGERDSEKKTAAGKLNRLPNSVELCKECHNETFSGDDFKREPTIVKGECTIGKEKGEKHTGTSHTVKNAPCLLDPATLHYCFATKEDLHDTLLQPLPLPWQRGQVRNEPTLMATLIDGPTFMNAASKLRCEEMGQPRRMDGILEDACRHLDNMRLCRWNQKHLDKE